MSLHLDYRPRVLDEVMGNDSVVKALKAKLKRPEDMPHAMLFTGPSGCGKTTLARIVMRDLGCTEENIYEVDSADFRGIDTVREIRKKMRFMALGGGVMGWILDECHKLSNDAMNALLKALEDTPKHVFFCLATTEPHKLIKTLRTRCMLFEVEALSDEQMVDLLDDIIKEEGIKVSEAVLERIVDNALGCPRAALVTLDRIMDLEPKDMEEAAGKSLLEEGGVALELMQSLSRKKPWKVIAKILRELKEEPETIRHGVLGYFTKILLSRGGSYEALVIELFSEPFYNSGKAGLALACYQTCLAAKGK